MSDIANAGAGIIMGGLTDIANANMSSNNASQQLGFAKHMALFNKEQQIDLYNKTGYEADVKQMIAAGLNPALMYKGSGGGGSTNLATQSGNIPFTPSNLGKSMEIANQVALLITIVSVNL